MLALEHDIPGSFVLTVFSSTWEEDDRQRARKTGRLHGQREEIKVAILS